MIMMIITMIIIYLAPLSKRLRVCVLPFPCKPITGFRLMNLWGRGEIIEHTGTSFKIQGNPRKSFKMHSHWLPPPLS